jgi:L-amino acid N-acyltransferase YncA
MRTRTARRADAAAITRIFNEGIADRVATFETELRTEENIVDWLSHGDPLVVGEVDDEVVAWAAAHEYRPRVCYAGVGDYSIYVAREHRGAGLGRPTLLALLEECEHRGYWKLVARIFPENTASLALARAVGFREVGFYRRHAKLDGEWRDCVIVERLLGDAAR